MTTRQGLTLSQAQAEEILTGRASGPLQLAEIITAARGPADSNELAGEAAAMIRFQAARLEPTIAVVPPARRRLSERVLAAKLGVVAALAAAATGGVALAATAHTQTNPPVRPAASANVPVAEPTPAATRLAPRSETAKSASHAATTSTTPPPSPSRSVPVSHPPVAAASLWVRSLCTAYRARALSIARLGIDNPVFAALVTAAGGKTKVAAYCDALLRADPHPTSAPKSYPLGPPITWPGETPPARRTGEPDAPPASSGQS